jgi:hypothetical protein
VGRSALGPFGPAVPVRVGTCLRRSIPSESDIAGAILIVLGVLSLPLLSIAIVYVLALRRRTNRLTGAASRPDVEVRQTFRFMAIVPLAQDPPDVAGATLWIAVVLVATALERWRPGSVPGCIGSAS